VSSIGLARTDLANLRRDPMLVAAGVAPLLVAGLVMFGFDPLAAAVAGFVELDRPLVVAAALLLVPLLTGFVVGFLLVEENEERILDAVAVTPLGTSGFLKHRLVLPATVGAVAAVFLGAVVGDLSLPALLAVAVLGGATACLVTMTMAAFARDRVQALAVSKLTGFLLVAAVAFQFVDGWWRVPLGVLPATWLVDVAVSPTVWPPLLLGLITHLAVGLVLWRRLQRRML
jgi:fluoroquinolone transport system permease protein